MIYKNTSAGMAVVRGESTAALADQLGAFVVEKVAAAVKERGVFHVALSGGSLPKVRPIPSCQESPATHRSR